jgi:hypothetical protein
VRACPKEGAIYQTNEPAPFALKQENINNGWNKLYAEALESRELYAAEKKRKAAEKAAAAKQDEVKPNTESNA